MSAPILLGRWRLPARPDALAGLRAELRTALAALGATEPFIAPVVLALNEACMNVVQHAYAGNPEGVLELEMRHDEGMECLVFQVLDYAAPVDPATIRPRKLDDVRPGGLGVHFIRTIMDAVEYPPPPPGYGNCLSLAVRLDRTFPWEG